MYQEVFNLIEKAETVTIFGHIFPDGDCYGSEIGLKMALRHYYPDKKIYAIGGGFNRVPSGFPGFDEVSDEVIAGSLAIIVDLANKERLNDQRALLAPVRIKIDHHVFVEKFADVEVVEDGRVSCAEILTNIIAERFGAIPPEAAGPLFLGIVTDSGRFLYDPVDADLFRTVSRLLETGIDVKKIYEALYTVDLDSLKFKGYIYQNFRIEDGIAYLAFSRQQLAELGISRDQAAVQVNAIGSIRGCYCWVFFAEGESDVRVELRSSGFPVEPIARRFKGGGHLQAAGCKLSALEEYRLVLDVIKHSHAEWEKGLCTKTN